MQDVKTTVASNGEYLGFVFAESKRRVEADDVAEWLKVVPVHGKKIVALFVNERIEEIEKVVKKAPIDIIQCHGSESPEEVKAIKERCKLPVWKAIHHSKTAIDAMKSYEGIVDGFIIDSKVKGQWGGTGQTFDWSHIPAYIEEGKRQGVLVFIAGGITPENVSGLLSYKPAGIDISSGIESEEQKNAERISQIEMRVNQHGHDIS